MTKKISRFSKGLAALLVFAVIAISSCNDNATTKTTTSDSPVMAPMDTMHTPPAMDTMPVTDTGRDTKVPRN
ncbi:MAG: hypothetical protein ABI151_07305 [Chitinophagaceae bacterium]